MVARITKTPCSGSRNVSIDLDMFHHLCLLANGDTHQAKEEENVEDGAPST